MINTKRLLIAFFVTLLVAYVYEFVVYGVLLHSFHATQSRWLKPEAEMNMLRMYLSDAVGVALITVSIWNLSGDLTKRWLVQSGSSTRRITYRVGDLAPGVSYDAFKNGVPNSVTADSSGTITFQDSAVTTGLVEFIVRLH